VRTHIHTRARAHSLASYRILCTNNVFFIIIPLYIEEERTIFLRKFFVLPHSRLARQDRFCSLRYGIQIKYTHTQARARRNKRRFCKTTVATS